MFQGKFPITHFAGIIAGTGWHESSALGRSVQQCALYWIHENGGVLVFQKRSFVKRDERNIQVGALVHQDVSLDKMSARASEWSLS
jgi:hypothetical protein